MGHLVVGLHATLQVAVVLKERSEQSQARVDLASVEMPLGRSALGDVVGGVALAPLW